MPRGTRYTDPYAAERMSLAEQRFTSSQQNAEQRYSLSQESQLLRIDQMRFQATEARQKIALERYKTAHAAEIVSRMGGLNINDPQYEVKRAQILADHAPGLNMAKDWVKEKDSVWAAQQKANAHKDTTGAESVAKLANAAKTYGTLADSAENPAQQAAYRAAAKGATDKVNALLGVNPEEVKPETTPSPALPQPNLLQRALIATGLAKMPETAPAATAALNAVPAQPGASTTPTTTPAAPTDAAAIATQDATAFLQKIGVGTPPPAAQPTAQPPVQAAQSGLPDAADEAASPSAGTADSTDDEETP